MAEIPPEATEHDVSMISDATQLIDFMRKANSELIKTVDPQGKVWTLRAGERHEYLRAGVRGEVGALVWEVPGRSYVPRMGLNEGYEDYSDAEGDDEPLPPGSEVPVEDVYKAVREYCNTLSIPASLKWVVKIIPRKEHDDFDLGSLLGRKSDE